MFETYSLKQAAEKVVPKKYLRVLGGYALRVSSIFYVGKKHECPCCGHTSRQFASYGYNKRENVLCRWCLSLERHRGLRLYFYEKTDLFKRDIKMLHIAPEDQLQKIFKEAPNIDYLSADLDMPTAMVKMDITDIQMPDNTFDVIVCNHVLEHIPDDHKAMSELYRVLKPNGWAILQTPMRNEPTTLEDLSITDPKELERIYGQNDHVRTYGMDKKDRLEKAGFEVVLDKYFYELDDEIIERYRIMRENIWLCIKK